MSSEEVVDRLDTLIRLVSIGLLVDKSQKEKIGILSSAGLQPKQIAELLGTTPNTVSVALANLRKNKAQSRGRGRSSQIQGGDKGD